MKDNRRTAWRVLLLVLELAIALAVLAEVGEVYLKVKGAQTVDYSKKVDPLCFVPQPGTHASEEEPGVNENIWPNGMRICRPSFPYTKKHRIMVSGCSNTFGVGVPDEQTYVYRLNAICPEADFDNVAVGGYGPYRCLMRQKNYLPRTHYDLVIYAMLENHLERSAYPRLTTIDDGHDFPDLVILPYVERVGSDSFVEHPLEVLYWPWAEKSRLVNFLRNAVTLGKARLGPKPSEDDKKAIFAYLVNRMAVQAKQFRARFVLVVLDRNPVPVDMFSPDIDIFSVPFTSGGEIPEDYRVAGGKGHPNGLVHEHWAESIAEQLRAKHYLD